MFYQWLAFTVIFRLSVATTDYKYRLYTSLVPSSYQLLITPYFETNDESAFTFDGEVTIQFTTTERTKQIKLHSQDLNFTAANITVTNLTSSDHIEVDIWDPLKFDDKYSFTYINLQEDLIPNVQYAVKISYKGPIRTDLFGFYRSYYLENGVKKWLAVTQMEPTHARKVFPCFDEPDLKATFDIQIDRPSNYKNSLTNTKMLSSTNLGNSYIRETFCTSPKMSTYLVAIIVSEFETNKYNNGAQEFGVYARPDAKNLTSFASSFAKKVVDELSNYFGVDYYSMNENLTLNHVAIPDFKGGGMENWGLLEYREDVLLYDPTVSVPFYKYQSARLLAHETTHMWFGNLVTCHWWSDVWLNEGFATYFHNYITAIIEPELGSANRLVTGSVYSAYDADNHINASPISNYEVNSPSEITNHFSRISYFKAGSVIRMIHHLIGDDSFKLGVHTYLSNNAFSTGYRFLLYFAFEYSVIMFKSLSAYPNITITDVMSPWITRPGYPIVNVKVDFTTGAVVLTQRRFFSNSSITSNDIYKIPITYTTGTSPNFNNTKPAFIMSGKTHEFTIKNYTISQKNNWVLLNIQETGLYRVNYDVQSWQKIASTLKGEDYKIIHHLNRAKIVNDLFAFFFADEIDFSVVYDVLSFMTHEDDYSVWFAALKGFTELRSTYLGHTSVLTSLDKYILKLIATYLDRFGYEERPSGSYEDLINRQQILEFACTMNHSECIKIALAKFKALKEDGIEVSPSLRSVVYSTGLRFGTGEDYDFLWNRMLTANVANEVSVILSVLGHTPVEKKLKSYLVSMTAKDSPVRTQDLTEPLSSVMSNYSNLNLVMEHLKNNYALWTSIYENDASMNVVLVYIGLNLRTESDFNEFEAFTENCLECSLLAKNYARSSLERSRAQKLWADKLAPVILSTLETPKSTILTFGLKKQLMSFWSLLKDKLRVLHSLL